MEQYYKVYSKWLELDTSKLWAIGTQDFSYRHVHVPIYENIHVEEEKLPTIYLPVAPNYPVYKIRAGLVCHPNCFWIIHRNFEFNAQEFLMAYLKREHNLSEPALSKGNSSNQNDVMLFGKKVLGQICFERGGQTYFGCFIDVKITDKDREDLLKGMEDDRNFFPDKIEWIGGIKDLVPEFDENKFIAMVEDYFMQSGVPEMKKVDLL